MMIIILLLICSLTAAATPFNGENALAYIDTLCSEEFAGRKSGDAEAALAEKWVAGKFAEFGLIPGGTEGYFQTFPILNNSEKKVSFTLVDGYHGKKKFTHGEDFQVITNSGSGKIKAEVVFIGYGIDEPDLDYNDFDNIGIEGKVALIYQEVPNSDRIWADKKFRDYKVNNAVEHGAAAILFVRGKYPLSGVAVKDNAFYPEIPMFLIGEHVAVDIFRGTGKNFEHTQKALKKGPQSFNTGKTVELNARLIHNPDAVASNVIGLIPGGDHLLGQEWVIVGGHLDHNGRNAAGDVFHGADDNASGAAIVMELARCFAALDVPPERSMMFIAFAAEEQGLLGSKYYVDNPLVPLEYTAAMFNFDCCGIGEGNTGFGGKEHFPDIWDSYKTTLSEEDNGLLQLSTCWSYGSDNTYYEKWGVSSFNYWSSGSRPFYHHVEDLPGMMSFDAVNNCGRLSYDFISYFSDWEKSLVSEYNRSRTLLYSAHTIDLSPPLYLPEDTLHGKITDEIKLLRSRGLKSRLAGLHADDLYAELDGWRTFCDDNGLRWITGGDQLNNAVRNEKFALFPVLCDIENLNLDPVTLKTMDHLRVRTIFIDHDFTAADSLAEILILAGELGMTFILGPEFTAFDALPAGARIVRYYDDSCPDLISAEDFDDEKMRFIMQIGAAVPLALLTENDRLFHLALAWSGDYSPEKIDKYFKLLEQDGLERSDIKYLLGDNLLELLTW